MDEMQNVPAEKYHSVMALISAKTPSLVMQKMGSHVLTQAYIKIRGKERLVAETYVPINDNYVVARYEPEKAIYRIHKRFL
jgi:hypothetical protein